MNKTSGPQKMVFTLRFPGSLISLDPKNKHICFSPKITLANLRFWLKPTCSSPVFARFDRLGLAKDVSFSDARSRGLGEIYFAFGHAQRAPKQRLAALRREQGPLWPREPWPVIGGMRPVRDTSFREK